MAATVDYDGQILLSTLWNQQDIIKCGNNSTVNFNDHAPLDPLLNVRSDTGCVNTAMGQIIYYFLEQNWLDFNFSLTEQDIFVSFGNAPRRAIAFTVEGNENTGLYSFAEINEMLSVFVPAPTDTAASDYSVKSEAAAEWIIFSMGIPKPGAMTRSISLKTAISR